MSALERINILVPVMNNQDTLGTLVSEVTDALDEYNLDFVFVEDASTDGSRNTLQQMALNDDRIKIILNGQNLGQQASIRLGLAQCTGDGVVVMDADLQDPPSAIPVLLSAMIEGQYDVVFAARIGQYQSLSRTLSGRLFRRVLCSLTNLPKGAGGFVAMRGHVAIAMAANGGKRFYLPGLIGCGDYRMHAVPVTRSRRTTGRSAFTSGMRWKTGFSNILAVLQERVFHAKR